MTLALTVFIDGLKPESIKHMPFLNSFNAKQRIRTEFGYSPICYATMFTGVYPSKHLCWFSWKYSPSTSPYNWIKKFKLDKLPDNIFTRYVYNKLTDHITHGLAPPGIMGLKWWNLPVRYWSYFDLTIKRQWYEPRYINFPTIFDILRENDIPFKIVMLENNLSKVKVLESENGLLKASSKTIGQCFDKIRPWVFFFIGDIDGLSHSYGQDSEITIKRLKWIDIVLKTIYRILTRKAGDFCFMVFSDHGHIKVKEGIQLNSFFKIFNDSLDSYIHFIDANFARFWFREEHEKQQVERVLLNMEKKRFGFILTEKHVKEYNLKLPDNRYGDLIFYLDAPHVFSHKIKLGWKELGHDPVSMHGYLPDYPDSNGVLISNKTLSSKPHIKLVDITPSILSALDLKIPSYIDGEVIWEI